MVLAASRPVIAGEWIQRTRDELGTKDIDLLHSSISAGPEHNCEFRRFNQQESVQVDADQLTNNECHRASPKHDQDLTRDGPR